MPKARSVSERTLRISVSSTSAWMVAAARKPKPPALLVAATSFASATQPIAVCTMG